MNAITAYLLASYPHIAAFLIAIVIGWFISRFYSRFAGVENRVAGVGNRVTSTENRVIGVENRVAGVENWVTSAENRVTSVEKILQTVCDWIRKRDNKMIDIFSLMHSPRALTDIGREFYEKSGGKNVLEQNMKFYIAKLDDEMKKQNLKSAFDVENKAYYVLFMSASDDLFIPVKNYLYNNPQFDGQNVDVSEVCFVMSLQLRDEYLKRHPEINQAITL
jgi:hypothetical protein